MKNLSSIINLKKIVFNPLLFSIPISCPLNTSENQRLSRVFWGLKNGNIGQKWANSISCHNNKHVHVSTEYQCSKLRIETLQQ